MGVRILFQTSDIYPIIANSSNKIANWADDFSTDALGEMPSISVENNTKT